MGILKCKFQIAIRTSLETGLSKDSGSDLPSSLFPALYATLNRYSVLAKVSGWQDNYGESVFLTSFLHTLHVLLNLDSG